MKSAQHENSTGNAGSATDILALAGVLLVALAVHGWIAAWDHHATTFTDSMDYLFMADFYRALLYGGEFERAAEFYRVTRFPPLFPLILGAFGGGTEHQHLASLVSNGVAVLAAAAVWWWVRIDLGRWSATVVAIALVVFPFYFAFNLTPISEPLGILLCAGAFGLLANEPVGRTRLMAAALLIGLAPLARTALLPLCIGFVCWFVAGRSRSLRESILPLAAAFMPFIAWTAYRSAIRSHQYTSYLNAQQYADAGITLPSALWQQPARLFDASLQAWGIPSPPMWMAVASAVLVALAAVGCLIRLRRNRLDAWFLAGYVALILIWPFPSEHSRFTIAVYPFVLVSAVTAIQWVLVRAAGPARFAPFVLAGLLLALGMPAAAKFAQRAARPVPPQLLGEKREPAFFIFPDVHEAMLGMEINGRARLLLERAGRELPPGECIYSLPPQFGRLYSRQRVLAYPPDLGVDPLEVSRTLDDCNYYFVVAWRSRTYDIPPLYPMNRLTGWTEPVLVSNVEYRGRELMAAGLFRRRQPPGHELSPADVQP